MSSIIGGPGGPVVTTTTTTENKTIDTGKPNTFRSGEKVDPKTLKGEGLTTKNVNDPDVLEKFVKDVGFIPNLNNGQDYKEKALLDPKSSVRASKDCKITWDKDAEVFTLAVDPNDPKSREKVNSWLSLTSGYLLVGVEAQTKRTTTITTTSDKYEAKSEKFEVNVGKYFGDGAYQILDKGAVLKEIRGEVSAKNLNALDGGVVYSSTSNTPLKPALEKEVKEKTKEIFGKEIGGNIGLSMLRNHELQKIVEKEFPNLKIVAKCDSETGTGDENRVVTFSGEGHTSDQVLVERGKTTEKTDEHTTYTCVFVKRAGTTESTHKTEKYDWNRDPTKTQTDGKDKGIKAIDCPDFQKTRKGV